MNPSENPDGKDHEREHADDPASSSERDPMGSILDSFLARLRQGEWPSLTEYIGRYPGLADHIRELFPALVEIEQLGAPGAALAEVDAGDEPGMAGAAEALGPGAEPVAAVRATGATKLPDRLGDYRILGCIGQGGMGVVYEAVRESLHNRVALKVMHPRFRASAGYLRRFHNEARSAAQLHHTNIVSVFDYGEHDGVCYYAMQFIAGHSLDEILVDVCRLRSNPTLVKAVPLDAGPATGTTGQPASNHADRGAAGASVPADPLMRTVTQGLMTGRFALGAGVTLDPDLTTPPTSEPIAQGVGARTAAAHDLACDLVRPQAPSSPPARDQGRNDPEAEFGSSSSALAVQGEDRYHREVAHLGA
jgi:hypothetical protein